MFKLTPFEKTMMDMDKRNDFGSWLSNFFDSVSDSGFRYDSFKVDIKEKDDEYLIKADMPGIEKDDIKISYNDDTLSVQINKDEKNEEKEDDYICKERVAGSMRRSFNVPGLDAKSIKAKLDDGVLTISAKKDKIKLEGHNIEIQ